MTCFFIIKWIKKQNEKKKNYYSIERERNDVIFFDIYIYIY